MRATEIMRALECKQFWTGAVSTTTLNILRDLHIFPIAIHVTSNGFLYATFKSKGDNTK